MAEPQQIVELRASSEQVIPGESFTVDVFYTSAVEEPDIREDVALVNHFLNYDSSQISVVEEGEQIQSSDAESDNFSNVFEQIDFLGEFAEADAEQLGFDVEIVDDGREETDRFVNFTFSDIEFSFPGTDDGTAILYTIEFQTSENFEGTELTNNVATGEAALPANFDPEPIDENLTIEARDLNENQAPNIIGSNPDPIPPLVLEEFELGEIVFTVEATDPDGELVSFEITDGNEDVDGDGQAVFAVNDEGVVTVQDADDLEADNTFNLDIIAINEEGVESDPVTFDVEVEAASGEPPQFVGAPFTFESIVAAEAENGDKVGTVEVENPEETNFEFIESNTDVDNDGNAAFAIADDGVVTINDVDDLESDFQLTVEATNEFGSNEANVTIPFTTGDSFPVITPPDAPITITEDFQVGDEVFTVEANDPAGGEITFEITEGNEDIDSDGTVAFAVNDEGVVTVQDTDDLVEGHSFNLEVTARDEFGIESEPETFTINVNDLNEPPDDTPANRVAIPIMTNAIPDQEVVIDAENTTLNLFDNFDDPFTTGLVARFELFNPENTFPNEGVTEVVLFDQDDKGAPLTVENFTNYVEDGDYVNSIIHRSVSDFVIQGGGFFIDESPSILPVPTDDPVQNEFSSDRSNLEGTIAMAKLGNDPDSATSQWFFNLEDNSTNINPDTGEDLGLDNQNGGFTVFGELLSEQDAETVNTIAELPPFNLSEQLGGAFNTVPINIENPDNPPPLTTDDFVRYERITISQQEELEFTVTTNSNPQLVEARIEEGELILDYSRNQTGEADLTIQATNLVGETVEDTFSVTVNGNNLNQAPTDITLSNTTINENVPANSFVGTFSTTDPDQEDSFTYSFVSGEGDNDNDLFTIDGETLSLDISPDFETKDSYSIRVQTEDSGGETFTETFDINIEENLPPEIFPIEPIFLLVETANNGTKVFTVEEASDPDGDNQAISFEIIAGNEDVDGDGFSPFAIDDEGAVTVQDTDELEADDTFNLEIVATDEGGLESNPATFVVEIQEEELSSDFNNDGFVNLDDLGIFASAFGSQQGEDNFNPIADLTGDGFINLDDLGTFASEFG